MKFIVFIMVNKLTYKKQSNAGIYSDTAVKRAVFRSGSSLSDVLITFCYSRETRPSGSDSHGCFTLHFAKNVYERRANSLKPTLPTAKYRSISF